MNNNNQNKFFTLITTSDETTWILDRPIIFLGEWCVLSRHSKILEEVDFEIASPFILKYRSYREENDYLNNLREKLLSDLTNELNKIHGVLYNQRYWNILLGNWLVRCVNVIYNRYNTIEKVLTEQNINAAIVLDNYDKSKIVTNESLQFIWSASINELWDFSICSRIINYLVPFVEKIPKKPSKEVVDNIIISANRGFFISKWVHKIKKYFINKVLPLFSKSEDAFVINSYLPKKQEFNFQLSLGQVPQFWESPKPIISKWNEEIRIGILLKENMYCGFEFFIRSILPELIPTCYIEGYKNLNNQVASLPWPKKPKFIFTSNNFDTDEIFKFYTALNVSKGVPYFVGQHGSNYGTLYGSQYSPEQTTCDKFLTWGWTNGITRNIPAFNFKINNYPRNRRMAIKGILLIELHPLHRIGHSDEYAKFKDYLTQQFEFVSGLEGSIFNELTIRLHSASKYFDFNEQQQWRDKFSSIKIDNGVVSIQKLVFNNRLIIHSYDSTGILETLALNRPTICFWHEVLDHLLDEAKPHYQSLINVGILHGSAIEAANFVTEKWAKLEEWWFSMEVQKARKYFCSHYSRIENSPILFLKKQIILNTK